MACGKEEVGKNEIENVSTEGEKETKDEEKENKETIGEEKNEQEKEKKSEENDNKELASEIMNPAIAEETDGDVDVLYTNANPEVEHDMDGFIVKVNKYQVTHVTDMKQSEEHRLEDLEGYVITADIAIENTSDHDIYYTPNLRIQTDDRYDYIPSKDIYYVAEDNKLKLEENFKSGSKHNFFHIFILTEEEYEKVLSLDPKLIVEAGASKNKDFADSYREEGFFGFPLNEKQSEKAADATDFYQDKLTIDGIATKELISEKKDINESQEIDKFKITIEGVQYTDIVPNESSKERFKNFGDNDLVAMTIQVSTDNQSDVMTYNDSSSAKLIVNDGEERFLSQRMVENYNPRELNPGDSGERQIVFIFQKKYFELYEKFDLEMGPFMGKDGYEFKEKTMEFEIPAP